LESSIPAILNTVVAAGRLTATWLAAFQSEITTLIDSYVNHTDNSGNWDGSITAPPNWTGPDIITTIGDASRYTAPTVQQLTDDWIIQQFNILNLLKWVNVTSQLTVSNYRRIGRAATWADTETDFNNNSWIFRNNGTPFSGLQLSAGGTKEKAGWRADIEYNNPSFQHSADLYGLSESGADAWIPWYNADQEDKYNLLEQELESSTINVNIANPESEYTQSYSEPILQDTNQFDVVYIAKFDGANGFTYKDW